MKLRNGAIINDRYIIDEKIGSGGMAIVYRATDTKLDRVVTLKVMREDYIQDDEFIERFYTEAQAAARLNHPNIVKVYDVDRIGDILFIVMEYINGITLKEAIRARKMFTNEEVLGVSIQIASAIDCAHKNYIIHRDIKPQNILLTPMGEVKVTDFGIARAANAKTTTATATTLGSVHYFSPEQARGGYVDHKSDIYALGITMFEMASGRLPFDDETVVTIALKHINDDLPDLKSINPDISDSVIEIINHATEKSQMRRYENAEIMGNDLKKALTNESLGGYKDYEDLSLTQTLKISQDDMNKIREKSHKNVDIENVSDEYRDDIKMVADVERRKYQEQQRNNLRGRNPHQKSSQQRQEELREVKNSQKENKNKVLIYAILTGLLISFVIMGSVIFGYSRILKKPMEVPNLVDMTLDEAKEEGELKGFEVEVDSYSESTEYEAGTIMEQDFQEGDKFYAGGTIRVVVSEGFDSVVVPDVLDLTEEDAVRQLEEAGFLVRVKDMPSEDVREGRVAEQAPKAQNVAQNGSTVTIYLSSGEEKPDQTTVPNVVGITESAAKTAIANAQLIANVTYKDSSFTTKGNVISQSISAGESVDVQSEITIVVSTGAAEETTDNSNTGTETPTEKPPATKTIVINQSMIPSGYETVFVKVVADSTGSVIYEKEVGVNDFPINISVSGKGTESYTVYTKIEGGEYAPSASKEVSFE